jgi:hypothetical protein
MADRPLLVVEGPDDKHVLWAILTRHQFAPQFTIRDEGGFETLIARASIHMKPGTDVERFGIVVDADADIRTRWQEVKRLLNRAGYAGIPDDPDPAGTVVDHEDLPRVGIWIMPDNSLPGMLEDYLCFLVPAGDVLLDRARHCVSEIPADERRFVEAHATKALIHTWLAWREDPGTPLGQAITKRYFDPDCPHVSRLLAWLTRLFA